jgi:DNA repair protein RecO (recombination protein O)
MPPKNLIYPANPADNQIIVKTFKTRGLVLREYEAGESDKRLLLLCKGVGRLFIYARGARNAKSKFIAAAQLFTYGDFTLAQGRGFHSLTQAAPIETFYHLRHDYDALCAAHLIMEICEHAVLEDENCDELMLLTLKALTYLNRAGSPVEGQTTALTPQHILAVYMLRFFVWYGVAPVTESCCICGEAVTEKPFFTAEGLICASHPTTEERIPLSGATATALAYIIHAETNQSFRFTAPSLVISQLQKAAFLLWRFHFDKELRSIHFIQ